MLPPPYYNDNSKSFAYPTVRERWPTILTQAIEEFRAEMGRSPARKASGESIIGALEQLMKDFEHDAKVAPFGAEDIAKNKDLVEYNAILADFNDNKTVTWLTGPWLFLECYLYQWIHTLQVQTEWEGFDVFETLKNQTFQHSERGVLELCRRYENLSEELSAETPLRVLGTLFREFIDISLWGNATDLSLLAGSVSLEDIESVQGAEVRKKNEQYIVVNDIDQVWERFEQPRTRVDLVLDNSGFELFADLALALFLLDSGLSKHVHFHCKEIPWFVSDTMPKDFENLLQQLVDPAFYSQRDPAITHFHDRVRDYVAKGSIVVQSHHFWTLGCNFWDIPKYESLYSDLLKSDLIIFKGDLNYRKLTGDLEWEPTTPFTTAIQDLAGSKLPVLSLRTCKADVVVGLPEGRFEELEREYEKMGRKGHLWASSGKWAVISYSGSHTN